MELNNKKICLTGGKGFLGKNIKDYFEQKNLDIFTSSSKEYDLTNLTDTKSMVSKCNPDIIVHAAADVGGIGYNRLYPADIFKNNLNIATNILESARKNDVKKVVLIGSACAYPGHVEGNMSEEDFLKGPMHESVEVYGFSKRALYLGAKAYKEQYGLNSIFLLLTNLYGPYDKFDPKESHVVAALIKKFVDAKRNNDKEVICWGTGKPIREFLYVDDCAEAIYLSAKNYEKLEPLNIGIGIGTSIKELAETTKDVVDFKGDIVWDSSKPDGAMKKILDVNKMEKELNWRPKIELKDGIKKTVEWYEKEMF